ncbi:MAG: Na+:solute symporter [Acidobacteriota bacterium]|jgi:Na+/proline symporter|nr:Na+:solute symporter [Acidobacteriota bacterium]NLT34022.1 Na+:solute symporter [Acidobacteriota bacterium]
MRLGLVDWIAVAAYFLFNILIGLYFRRRATKSTEDYFVGGRKVSWWLAGTSMVATTFAADTPLAVTGMVAAHGIAGNWLWWNMLMSGMLTVFFYARLWRRAGVLTDVEFAEIRYGGRPAAFLRGFRALYLGLPINCIILGWVNLAMVKILMLVFGIGKAEALGIVFGIMVFTALVSTLSGLWGVLVTDLFQFVLKMGMMILLAYFAVRSVGGMEALVEKLLELDAGRQGGGSILSFVPDLGSAWMPMITFVVYLAVNWWATWYPGAEPGGGGYIAQRILCAKDEKNSLLATLWFNIAHYALRPWPWILTALCSLVLYPALADKESGFIMTVIDPAVVPAALRGLMIAAFAAAYMSTVSTQLNWGASYLVNDVYRRFLARGRGEKHYVMVSQAATLLIMVVSCVVTYYQDSIAGAWKFLIAIGAGTGSVLILRWFWWRINAWSELAAMATSFVVSIFLQLVVGMDNDDPVEFAWIVLLTVAISTVAWLAATLLTRPERMEILTAFYRRVRPGAALWGPVAAAAPDVDPGGGLAFNLLDWFSGCVMVYMALFGVGKLIFGETVLGIGLLTVAVLAGGVIYRDLNRRGWESVIQ